MEKLIKWSFISCSPKLAPLAIFAVPLQDNYKMSKKAEICDGKNRMNSSHVMPDTLHRDPLDFLE